VDTQNDKLCPQSTPLANANAVIDMLDVYYPAPRGAKQNRKIPIGNPRSIQTGPNGTMGQNGSKIGNNNVFGESSLTPSVFFFLPVWYRTSCQDDQDWQQATTL
jgi:hypothetical protein